ncbi:hypothetical protein B0H13DRAFT_2446376 [Mycena leptocephala]|nr:hypothetical protein B0H13DRAFT_2446376 [Mycena leptocephala]
MASMAVETGGGSGLAGGAGGEKKGKRAASERGKYCGKPAPQERASASREQPCPYRTATTPAAAVYPPHHSRHHPPDEGRTPPVLLTRFPHAGDHRWRSRGSHNANAERGYTKQNDIPTLLVAGGGNSLISAPMTKKKMSMPMAEMKSESFRPRESTKRNTKMKVATTCGGRVSELEVMEKENGGKEEGTLGDREVASIAAIASGLDLREHSSAIQHGSTSVIGAIGSSSDVRIRAGASRPRRVQETRPATRRSIEPKTQGYGRRDPANAPSQPLPDGVLAAPLLEEEDEEGDEDAGERSVSLRGRGRGGRGGVEEEGPSMSDRLALQASGPSLLIGCGYPWPTGAPPARRLPAHKAHPTQSLPQTKTESTLTARNCLSQRNATQARVRLALLGDGALDLGELVSRGQAPQIREAGEGLLGAVARGEAVGDSWVDVD